MPSDNPGGADCRQIAYKMLLGTLLTVLIAFSWAGQTQFTKSAYTGTGFYAPFFLVWFGTLWMILCYPIYLAGFASCARFTDGDRLTVMQKMKTDAFVFSEVPLSMKSAGVVLSFTVLWIACNYAASQAIGHIPAAEFTVLFSCNSAMVFILSFFVLKEKFTIPKVCSILLCIAGVVCVSYDEGLKSFTVIGVISSVVSAFLAAVYKVGFKKIVGDANFGQVSLFMTCLGLANALIFWPIMVGLAVSHTEQIDLRTAPWGFIVGSSVLGFIFNLMINIGIAVTYPLFVSIGMFIGIPLNTLIDYLARGVRYSTLDVVGIVLIIISFLIILIPFDVLVKSRQREYSVVEASVVTKDEPVEAEPDIDDGSNQRKIEG